MMGKMTVTFSKDDVLDWLDSRIDENQILNYDLDSIRVDEDMNLIFELSNI